MPDNVELFSTSGDSKGDVTFFLQGRVDLSGFEPLLSGIKSVLSEQKPRACAVDLSRVTYFDSSGALLIVLIADEAARLSIPFTLTNISQQQKQMLSLIDRNALSAPSKAPAASSLNPVEQLGDTAEALMKDCRDIIFFSGQLLYEIVYSFTHPGQVRWNDVVSYMKKVGVDGLPIVTLISFLLGLIMAFMSALQLKQFGANIYVASLVALAMVRELGPIITAIIVAGRSGSAFAAEIGTMKVNEEVDALTTMGFNPIRFLAIPKVFASIIVFPVLTGFSDIAAVIGGMVVGVLGLNLTIYTYVQQTMKAVQIFDVMSGMIKSVVFAAAIAAIGCQRGFKVRGGAQAVGNATTSAVVSAIFLIIVIDSTFAIILHYIR